MSKRRVLFFTTSMGGGGAESHALRLMNALDRERFAPSLAVSRRGGSYEKFLADDTAIIDVGTLPTKSSTGRLISAAPGLVALLERERFDLMVSLMDTPNIVALGAAVFAGRHAPPVLACVQIPPSIEYARSRAGKLVLPTLARLYPNAARVIALSYGVERDLQTLFPHLTNLVTIHNACVDERVLKAAATEAEGVSDDGGPAFVAVGRLTYQKGYPYLLDAFSIVRKKHRCQLWILGQGPDRAALEQRIAELGIGDSVHLLGFRDNPQAYMARAHAFVLSSLYEGFGNVVAEALAVGTAVVSTDCPHGPSEIFEHDKSGLLVPVKDAPALAAAMSRILEEPGLRERLGAAGRERATAFTGEAIARKYEQLFEQVLSERAPS
ncbi:MAG: glycosyltransferase [Polyangiaceae bacterium]